MRSVELALALLVLLRFVRDRRGLVEFWERAAEQAPHPWTVGSCRESYYAVARALRNEGWDAPPEPASTPVLGGGIGDEPSRA